MVRSLLPGHLSPDRTRRARRALAVLFLVATVPAISNAAVPSEADALLAWKSSLGNPAALSTWTNTSEVCSWTGVACDVLSGVRWLDLSNLGLSGGLDTLDLASFPNLNALRLSGNYLAGAIPDSWWHMQALKFVDLSNNSLSGDIPAAPLRFNCSLESLHLAGNEFTGVFPSVIEGCGMLAVLDISNNRFFGGIPPWIGSGIPSLKILSLRSNNFSGEIPSELSWLSQLQLLDLSKNSLTGSIPREFGTLSSMKHPKIASSLGSLNGSYYRDRIEITWKGQERSFQRIFELMTGIDLSGNSLSQCIPEELTNLQGLRFLNLSRNHLSCRIPENIGSLKFLEFLDLSLNDLSGAIPPGMSNILSLEMLNFSNNHLSGKIPTGSQLQTLIDPSIYSNNSGLCGYPLDIPCTNTSIASGVRNGRHSEDQWLYYCVTAGIVFGFWLWFGMLFFASNWRSSFFFILDAMQCKIIQKLQHTDQFISK